jgi:hypothetical protein
MNNVLTTNKSYDESERILLKAKYALLQFALVLRGHDADYYSCLSPECYTNLVNVERRKCGWIDYYLHALALDVDPATIPNVCNCDTTFDGVIAAN